MNSYLAVTDFDAARGWDDSAPSQERGRWCCEQLEEGQILFFDAIPFDLPIEDKQFLLSGRLGDARLHKNISYRPRQDVLRGFAAEDAQAEQRMRQVMRRYSEAATRFMARLLPPYATQWTLDYASFRPEPEESRELPLRKRNDLLHVDAFPSRPTRGGRILRCFSNINPSEARVWCTTEGFSTLAQKYAKDAGLAQIAARGTPALELLVDAIKRMAGVRANNRSSYDRFMLRFHDYLKENAGFQQNCEKISLEFPPGSTWICFTDAVPHSVLRGQYALEQTFIVPLDAMITPQKSPLRVLESLAGQPLAS